MVKIVVVRAIDRRACYDLSLGCGRSRKSVGVDHDDDSAVVCECVHHLIHGEHPHVVAQVGLKARDVAPVGMDT